MIQFENKYWLLALLVLIPVILVWLYHTNWRNKVIRKIGSKAIIENMVVGFSAKRRKAKWLLILTSITCLAFALPNLQRESNRAGGGFSGLDVMLVMDVSNSMLANDIQPNRMEKAKLFAGKLIDQMVGNRVGIVAFAKTAHLQLPLTTDINAARLFLHSINPSLIADQGTNINQALEVANASMNPAELKYKAVVLITDGEELEGSASQSIEALKKSGVYLITVGVGNVSGGTVLTSSNEPKFDSEGKIIVSKLNENLLKSIAAKAGGNYLHLDNSEETTQAVLTEINQLDKKPISNSQLINYESLSYWLIWVAFILLLIEMYLPDNILAKTKIEGMFKRNTKIIATLSFLSLSFGGYSQKNAAYEARLSLLKANEAYKKGKLDEAEKHYYDVLKTDPKNTVANGNIGNIALKRKQFKEAAENYEKVLENKDFNKQAAINNNLGLSNANEKQLQAAIDNFKTALKGSPYDTDIRQNLYKAMQELEQQQQQQQQNNKDQQQKDKQEQNQQKEQQKNQDNQQEKQQKEQQQEKEQQQKQKDADNKLQALQQEEQKIRERMSNKKGQPQNTGGGKDW
ncbi:VWA domain-containing protein [Polluticaenibacter yanchengensis]|uniref:VWA domain-containing protein n=1 Tax=Polluticaenibacter yanchengensis TaxID=3014562 RepID=A0ABT4UI95_9BACT|nr:VWA domain-containing protein [Chitinophagaceae bacterium LY-5]